MENNTQENQVAETTTQTEQTQERTREDIEQENQELRAQLAQKNDNELLNKHGIKDNLKSSVLKLLNGEEDKEKYLKNLKATQPEFFISPDTNIRNSMNIPKSETKEDPAKAENDKIDEVFRKAGIGK